MLFAMLLSKLPAGKTGPSPSSDVGNTGRPDSGATSGLRLPCWAVPPCRAPPSIPRRDCCSAVVFRYRFTSMQMPQAVNGELRWFVCWTGIAHSAFTTERHPLLNVPARARDGLTSQFAGEATPDRLLSVNLVSGQFIASNRHAHIFFT